MKLRRTRQRNRALTLIEAMVVIMILAVLTAMLLPANYGGRKKSIAMRVACMNNLKQVAVAYHNHAGDTEPDLQLQLSTNRGSVLELAQNGNAVLSYLVMSNEIGSAKILVCPADTEKFPATNFPGQLNPNNVSYFVGIDAEDGNPGAILSGDDNFQSGGAPVKPGLFAFSTNDPVGWTMALHKRTGNIGLADGSVQVLTSNTFHTWLLPATGLATNRLVIP